MRADYLGKLKFAEALKREQEAFARVAGGGEDEILAFETGPVITLGVRGGPQDLEWSAAEIQRRGFEVLQLDRGGQATLHNPGQLVIFPIVNIRALGARAWVDHLLEASRLTLREFGKEARCRPNRPGLYSDLGKLVAVGIRVRNGVSTHGVSINVSNNLSEFGSIRPCGVRAAPVDKIGDEFAVDAVFAAWLKNFKHRLTSAPNLTNLECSSEVRL